MAESLLDYYRKHCFPFVESTLKGLVGKTPDYVVDENLYRTHVVERGWNSLPGHIRRMGRDQLRWDEILLALRREVYASSGGKLSLRPDAPIQVGTVLGTILGRSEATIPTAVDKKTLQTPEPAPPTMTPAVRPPVAAPARPQAAPPAPAAPSPARPTQPMPAATPRPAPAVPAPAAPARSSQPTPAPAPAAPARSSQPTPAPAQRPAQPPAAPAGPPALALGIDLGTTYSVVAYLDAQGRPVSILNSTGDLLTPSVVLFDDGGVVVGKEAVLAASMEPDKVADSCKRDMGAKAYRKKLQGKDLPPEVISSFILKSMKEDAERKLGPVKQAVITVPAYFDEARRRATMDAGRLAGLDVLDIINEPTAAALAYGYQLGFLDRKAGMDRPLRVLVYDLGGGTFDVTIVEIHGTSFKALATDGDVFLGGKDWDEKLVDMAAERFKKQCGSDPRLDPNALQELWIGAEAAKRTLTERGKASMYVNAAGKRFKVEITREEFEAATAPLLGRTRATTEIVVRQSGLKFADIDKFLLVGGSTRMPMVSTMLKELTGKEPERSISADEAVAHGAALYADLVLGKQRPSKAQSRFSVTNVNSHSLGIVGTDPVTKKKKNQILIPKNTPLPATVTKVFKTAKVGQAVVAIRVVEGESEKPEACSQVGVCSIKDLPANLPANTPVEVSYNYSESGRLKITARIAGHPAMVTSILVRDNSLEDNDLSQWADFVAKQWGKRG